MLEKKKALFAVVKENEGIYKKVQLTEEESKLTFPFDPLYWFYNGPGYILLDNFISFHNNIAVNITNLDGFIYKTFVDDEIKEFNKKTRIINKIAVLIFLQHLVMVLQLLLDVTFQNILKKMVA